MYMNRALVTFLCVLLPGAKLAADSETRAQSNPKPAHDAPDVDPIDSVVPVVPVVYDAYEESIALKPVPEKTAKQLAALSRRSEGNRLRKSTGSRAPLNKTGKKESAGGSGRRGKRRGKLADADASGHVVGEFLPRGRELA